MVNALPVIIGKVIREEKTTYNENPFSSDVLIDIINEEHKRYGSNMEYALRSLCALLRESTFALEKEAAIATSFTSFLEKSMKNLFISPKSRLKGSKDNI